MDEGPSLNWPPSEVKELSEGEVRMYGEALDQARQMYQDEVDKLLAKD